MFIHNIKSLLLIWILACQYNLIYPETITFSDTSNDVSLKEQIEFLEKNHRKLFDSTITISEKLLNSNNIILDSNKIALINYYSGIALFFKTYIDSAKPRLFYAIEKLDSNKQKNLIADAIIRYGTILRYESNYPEALKYLNNGLEIAKSINDKKLEASAYLSISSLYNVLDLYDKALEYNIIGSKLYEETGWAEGIAWSYYLLGALYLNLNQYNKALEATNNSLKYYRDSVYLKNDNKYGISICYSQLGVIYNDIGITDSALYYLRITEKLREEQGTTEVVATELSRLGDVYFNMGMYEIADSIFYKAYGLQKNIIYSNSARIIRNLAKTRLKLKKYSDALTYLNEAYQMASKFQFTEEQSRIQFFYYQLYSELGNYQLALESYKNFTELKDSIYNKETSTRMSFLQVEYDLYKKNQENDLLRNINKFQQNELNQSKSIEFLQRLALLILLFSVVIVIIFFIYQRKLNKRISAQAIELEKENRNKDKLFSIISHDLKNPFVSILGYSEILSNDFDSLSKNEIKVISNEVFSSAKKLYRLLETLLEWAAIQIGKTEITVIEFKPSESVNNVIDLYQSNIKEKNLIVENKISDKFLFLSDPNIFETIVRNLLNNAIKFSNNNGSIYFEHIQEEKEDIFCVRDNGKGMGKIESENLFEYSYSNNLPAKEGSGTGLGLRLTKDYLDKLGGKIWVQSEEGKGTTFFFTLNPKI